MTAHDRALHMPDKYRAWLERAFLLGEGTCVWVGLNPSTATEHKNDPTITREKTFTQREGCNGMVKINLFTARCTYPENLFTMDDPVGPDANDALERALDLIRSDKDRFILAYGAHPGGSHWFKEVYRRRVEHTIARAKAYNVKLWCLGFTDKGFPRHPLYVSGKQPLVAFENGGAI